MITKIIDNFTGALSRHDTGELNSGLAKYETSFGYNPFISPTDLTWFEQSSIIGSPSIINGSSPLNYGLGAAKVRVEGSLIGVYGVGVDGLLTKYQVTDTASKNPNYDRGSILCGTGFTNTEYGGSMQFYGSTEKIFVGGQANIGKINFDGSGLNPSVASASSVVANVPRPSVQFLGKMYFGNGDNLIEVDSTETVSNYAKLNPGFPSGSYIRDLDLTPDGNYMIITVSFLNETNPLTSNGAIGIIGNSGSTDSYKFLWNGTDSTYTAYTAFSGYSLTSNETFGEFNYATGYDLNGTALYSDSKKIRTLPNFQSPEFGATFSVGNMFGFMAPEYVSSVMQLQSSFMMFGQFDDEVKPGLFRLLRQPSTVPSVSSGIQQVYQVPLALPVTNLLYGDPVLGYTNNNIGASKIYFSTIERLNSQTPIGFIYKFTMVPTGVASVLSGVWESQNELFSKKVKPTELRFYTEPLVAGNSFKIEFVDSTSSVLGGQTFTAGTPPIAVGDDRVWWNPQLSPKYSWGVRVTNLGSTNWVGVKMEIDFTEAGK